MPTSADIGPTLLRDVSETLRVHLLRNITDLKESEILFDSPGQMSEDQRSKISLFLLQAKNDPYQSNAPRIIESSDTIRNAPLPIVLTYMITPYAHARETEFIFLEKTLRAFHDHGVLKGEELQGVLGESTAELRITPKEMTLDDTHRLWGMFPNKNYRPSAFYLVSPIYIQSHQTHKYTKAKEPSFNSTPMQ